MATIDFDTLDVPALTPFEMAQMERAEKEAIAGLVNLGITEDFASPSTPSSPSFTPPSPSEVLAALSLYSPDDGDDEDDELTQDIDMMNEASGAGLFPKIAIGSVIGIVALGILLNILTLLGAWALSTTAVEAVEGY